MDSKGSNKDLIINLILANGNTNSTNRTANMYWTGE